jgi:hypothetical protein
MTPYVYNYFKEPAANKASSANDQSAEAPKRASKKRGSRIVETSDEIFVTPAPVDAHYEMYGNYYKVLRKGDKHFVLAWGLDEWRLSNVSYAVIKRKGKIIRQAA